MNQYWNILKESVQQLLIRGNKMLKEIRYKLDINEVRRIIIEHLKEKDTVYNVKLVPRLDIKTENDLIKEEDIKYIQLSTV